MQGIRIISAIQMLMQALHSCTNFQNKDNTTIMRHGHGLPNGMQASRYGARAVLGRSSVKHRPNRVSSYLVPKLKSALPLTNMERQQ